MATTTGPRGGVKRQDRNGGDEAGGVVADQLEELARQGAREMLMAALQDERDAYLGRGRYERSDVHRGYRNGRTPHRLSLPHFLPFRLRSRRASSCAVGVWMPDSVASPVRNSP
ncbi:MAG TPA: hypothetical protein VM243_11710 [Phycisphaerae bacterium]|nr:hypothetical protein [Phycisphaerae bacterium]